MTSGSNFKRRLLAGALILPLLAAAMPSFAQAPAPAAPAAPAAAAQPAATPTSIGELRDMSALQLRGRVAERFGNAFVLEDDTGRTLVETGPAGERADLVAVGDDVTVEGRFERGQVRAQALTVAGGERVTIERPRPERDGPRGPRGEGPRGEGPRGHDRDGPRGHDRDGPRGPGRDGPREDGERRGGWFSGGVDAQAAQAALEQAGYTQITLLDTKKRHAEFTALDAAGSSWLVKVDEDNEVTERQPYRAPLSEDAARAAVEALGYTWGGDFEAKTNHVEADATDAAGRSVRVEIASDGSLRKERFDD